MTVETAPKPTETSVPRARRLLLAGLGVILVGLGAIGAILPGLPTTIFLIGASWCFARSCPWLEERLLRARIFRPFRGWLDPEVEITAKTRLCSIAVMWTAIAICVLTLTLIEEPRWILAGVVVSLGFVGTWFIWTQRRG